MVVAPKPGVRVRMTEELRARLRGPCERGQHRGAILPGLEDQPDQGCRASSLAHLEEFGDCVGILEGPIDLGAQLGPEWDVRWQPSGLRYAYHPDDLEAL